MSNKNPELLFLIENAIGILQAAHALASQGKVYTASKALRDVRHDIYTAQRWCANNSIKAALDFGNGFRIHSDSGKVEYGMARV